jgi:hypothetical protein
MAPCFGLVGAAVRRDTYAESYFDFWYVPINSPVPMTWP